MSTATMAPELVRNPADRAPSVHKQLSLLKAAACKAQPEATASIAAAHIRAGEAAGDYLTAAMSGVTEDFAKTCLVYIDEVIDGSQDGRSRKTRRPEIREQVCASVLVTHIPSIASMPWRHVRAMVGAKIVTFSYERGTGEVNLDWLQGARAAVGDYQRSPCELTNFRAALAAVTGRQTAEQRKEKRKAAAAAQKIVLERVKEALPTMSDAERAAVLRQYPELDSSFVHEETVVGALAAINPLRGSANYVECLARLLASTDAAELDLAMDRAADLTGATDNSNP